MFLRKSSGYLPSVVVTLLGKPERRRPLWRPRRRWVDNIRMDRQDVGCGYTDWIGLAQDRDRWRKLVSVVMNLRVPWNSGNFLTSCRPVSFSRRTLHHAVSKYIDYLSERKSLTRYENVTIESDFRTAIVRMEMFSTSKHKPFLHAVLSNCFYFKT